MRYIPPHKVKVLVVMFFVTGAVGMVMGLFLAPPNMTLYVTFLGVINFLLGAFFIYVWQTQEMKAPDKRKKKRKKD